MEALLISWLFLGTLVHAAPLLPAVDVVVAYTAELPSSLGAARQPMPICAWWPEANPSGSPMDALFAAECSERPDPALEKRFLDSAAPAGSLEAAEAARRRGDPAASHAAALAAWNNPAEKRRALAAVYRLLAQAQAPDEPTDGVEAALRSTLGDPFSPAQRQQVWAAIVPRLGALPLTETTRQVLRTAWQDPPPGLPRAELAWFALNGALASGAGDEAKEWAPQVQEALPMGTEPRWRRAAAVLAALDMVPVQGWSERVERGAWLCAMKAAPTPETASAVGRLDEQGWRWEGDDTLVRCLAEHVGPPSEAKARVVHVHVHKTDHPTAL